MAINKLRLTISEGLAVKSQPHQLCLWRLYYREVSVSPPSGSWACRTLVQRDLHHDAVARLGRRRVARRRRQGVVAHVGADAADSRAGAEGARAAQLSYLSLAAGQGPHPQAGAHHQRQQTLLYLLRRKKERGGEPGKEGERSEKRERL